ncbi:hypothetical protein ABZV34_30655 [Streptomyces sp. NPDC005195]|uniref:hypothetical protein n=1 Tax=Streptomyces sp. NPDC005195 TaxID=3154561 RepID=UPI0033AB604C
MTEQAFRCWHETVPERDAGQIVDLCEADGLHLHEPLCWGRRGQGGYKMFHTAANNIAPTGRCEETLGAAQAASRQITH